MATRARLLLGLGLALSLWAAGPAPQAQFAVAAPSAVGELPRNFHVVDGTLYRGGKIDHREQLQRLKERYGVTTVVCLAKDSLGPEGDNELSWAPELGIKVVRDYLTDVPPTEAQWSEIKSAMTSGHVYVHCKWGADRTGMVVARYRKEVQGWAASKAYAEARAYGFKPWLTAMKRWIGIEDAK